MEWSSREHIVQHLGLKSCPDDEKALKSEVRSRMIEINPDRNDGQGVDGGDDKAFIELVSAYHYLSEPPTDGGAIIPAQQNLPVLAAQLLPVLAPQLLPVRAPQLLPAIIAAVREAWVEPVQPQIAGLRTEIRSDYQKATHSLYQFRRLTAATAAAVCAFLFKLGGLLAVNPVVGPYSKNLFLQTVLVCSAGLAGWLYLVLWNREKKEEAQGEWLTSSQAREILFRSFVADARQARRFEQSFRFIPAQISDKIPELAQPSQEPPRRRLRRLRFLYSAYHAISAWLLPRPQVSASLAEKITKVHLLELVDSGAVRRVDGTNTGAEYVFAERITSADE